MKQQLEQRHQQQLELKKLFEIEQQQISKNRKTVLDAREAKGKPQKKVKCEKNKTSSKNKNVTRIQVSVEWGMECS